MWLRFRGDSAAQQVGRFSELHSSGVVSERRLPGSLGESIAGLALPGTARACVGPGTLDVAGIGVGTSLVCSPGEMDGA